MSRTLVLAAGLMSMVLPLTGCSKHEDVWSFAPPGQKRILASFPPLYCFAANVAGDKAAVQSLLSQVGPHEYETTPTDALKVRKAHLFLLNGLELDTFAVKLVVASGNKNVAILKIGDRLGEEHHDLLLHMDEAGHQHAPGEHHHHHGEHDPHIWLSPSRAKVMVELIRDRLDKLDPANGDAYKKNAAAYTQELDDLLAYGKDLLKDKKSKAIVTTHDSLSYFADDFGLQIVGYIQPRAGQEADAAKLAALKKLCKEKNVGVITVEPQYSRGTADTLRNALKGQGIDVAVVEVDPLETAPGGARPDPAFYVQTMRKNLETLAKALP